MAGHEAAGRCHGALSVAPRPGTDCWLRRAVGESADVWNVEGAPVSQPSLDLGYDDLPEPTYTVRELATAIKQVLQRGFRDGVWVRGEIQGLQQRNGHTYFTLAERGDEGSAAVPVALFANTAYRLRGLLARHRL